MFHFQGLFKTVEDLANGILKGHTRFLTTPTTAMKVKQDVKQLKGNQKGKEIFAILEFLDRKERVSSVQIGQEHIPSVG